MHFSAVVNKTCVVFFDVIFLMNIVQTFDCLAYRTCIPLREEANAMRESLVHYSKEYDRKVKELEKVWTRFAWFFLNSECVVLTLVYYITIIGQGIRFTCNNMYRENYCIL